MADQITRRAVLGGMALAPMAAAAQTRGPVEELQGALTARNAAAFGRFVSAHDGRLVSLKMTAAPAEGRGFSVALQAPLLLVNLDQPERMQVSVTGGYTLRDGAFALDGVYRVKAEGMQQGILILVLEPVPGGEVRRVRDAGVKAVPLS